MVFETINCNEIIFHSPVFVKWLYSGAKVCFFRFIVYTAVSYTVIHCALRNKKSNTKRVRRKTPIKSHMSKFKILQLVYLQSVFVCSSTSRPTTTETFSTNCINIVYGMICVSTLSLKKISTFGIKNRQYHSTRTRRARAVMWEDWGAWTAPIRKYGPIWPLYKLSSVSVRYITEVYDIVNFKNMISTWCDKSSDMPTLLTCTIGHPVGPKLQML